MKRCFIALNLPGEMRSKIGQIQVNLKSQNKKAQLTWVNPKIAHINLHFLGQLQDEQIKLLEVSLQQLEYNYQELELRGTKISFFYGQGQPRVLFLGVSEQSGNLVRLQADLAQILQDLKIKVDSRLWRPHITLARIKNWPEPRYLPELKGMNLTFKINSVELIESVLTTTRPEYKVIKSYKL